MGSIPGDEAFRGEMLTFAHHAKAAGRDELDCDRGSEVARQSNKSALRRCRRRAPGRLIVIIHTYSRRVAAESGGVYDT